VPTYLYNINPICFVGYKGVLHEKTTYELLLPKYAEHLQDVL